MMYLDFDYYKGPFDTLLELCSKNKIEINTINISEIIDVYLSFINDSNNNFNLSAQYLVLAAQLIEIKTRILLKLQLEEEQKLEITDFINSLLEYKQYKIYSEKLKELLKSKIYFEAKEPTKLKSSKKEYNENHLKNQKKLIDIYEKLLINFKLETKKQQIKKVNLSEISLSDVKKDLQQQIKVKQKITFSNLDFKDKIHLIVTFLALLELANTQLITIIEEKGDLNIYAI